ncbi:hypothetical protein LguiB_001839 [Lonicera macranthoides]
MDHTDGSIRWNYDDERRKLVDRFTGWPDQLEVISIVLNRTEEMVRYLLIHVYYDPYLLSHFQIVALTFFSQTKSLLATILCSIADYEITYQNFGNSDQELGQQLNKVLMDHRFLIFIDKLWYNTTDWDYLKRYFPDNGNGSRIAFCTLSDPYWFEFDVSVGLSRQPGRQPFETCDGVQL